jgi:DDE superfamily endonuclease
LEVVALACASPCDAGVDRNVWTQASLAEAVSGKTGTPISRSTVQRILNTKGLRPHRVRTWLHSPDPNFREKVADICRLYLEPPKGEIVVCIDEKPLQVLERRNPTHVRNGEVRREFEYRRHGTGCLIAAFEPKSGEVLARVVDHRDGPTLVDFVRSVAGKHRRRRIHVVWDNLNVHCDGPDQRWTALNEELGGRLRFHFTPLHASWCNQVEVWFSILQRRVIRNGSFRNGLELRRAIEAFVAIRNRWERRPFRWRFDGSFAKKESCPSALPMKSTFTQPGAFSKNAA